MTTDVVSNGPKKEKLGIEDYYKHTGNSKYGRRGLHKRLRKNAKNQIRRSREDN